MSLVSVLVSAPLALLLLVWYFRSVQRRNDQDEEDDKHIPPVPESLLSESYSVFDDLPDDNTPVGLTMRDLGTAPLNR